MTEDTAVYRLYDAADGLLYVGITLDIGRRFTTHAADKPWWSAVARIAVQHYPTRAQAVEAERAAIVADKPAWNVQHNRGAAPVDCSPVDAYVPLFRVGQVVAVGLEGDKCPVGMVAEVERDEFLLDLLHWGTGTFGGAGSTWVRDSEVRMFRVGRPMSRGQKRRGGYPDESSVIDCDPLADFQTRWTERWTEPSTTEVLT